jgi:hypothetical protein
MPKEVFKQSVDAPCIPEFNVRVVGIRDTVVSSNVKLQRSHAHCSQIDCELGSLSSGQEPRDPVLIEPRETRLTCVGGTRETIA